MATSLLLPVYLRSPGMKLVAVVALGIVKYWGEFEFKLVAGIRPAWTAARESSCFL